MQVFLRQIAQFVHLLRSASLAVLVVLEGILGHNAGRRLVLVVCLLFRLISSFLVLRQLWARVVRVDGALIMLKSCRREELNSLV